MPGSHGPRYHSDGTESSTTITARKCPTDRPLLSPDDVRVAPVREGDGTAIYYHPGHDYNLEEMALALDAALKYYAEWFPPPRQRVSTRFAPSGG